MYLNLYSVLWPSSCFQLENPTINVREENTIYRNIATMADLRVFLMELGLEPLSTIFQLYRGGQFY